MKGVCEQFDLVFRVFIFLNLTVFTINKRFPLVKFTQGWMGVDEKLETRFLGEFNSQNESHVNRVLTPYFIYPLYLP